MTAGTAAVLDEVRVPRNAPPRVTIGLPVRNGERYLAETVESILTQDFTDLELIISDNASTDRTAEIVRGFAARDRRVRWVRNPSNIGAAKNYNQLVALARGRYFKWAGYDDLLAPSHLSRCVEVLDSNPEVVIAYPRTTIIDGDGTVLVEHQDDLHLRSPDPVERLRHFTKHFGLCNPCFGVIRLEVLRRTRLVEPYVSSDVPLLVELALLGEWHEVPERLFFRRIHATSSRQGNVTLQQVAHWFEPTARAPLAPRTRVFVEILRVIVRADLPPEVRARAVAVFASTWMTRRARVRAGRTKLAVLRLVPG